MRREKITIKAIVLIIAFIPSLNLFWDFVSWIQGYREHYAAFQFMCAAYYTLLSVFFTSDCKRFNSFWEKHPKLKNYYERVLHCCAVVITNIPKYAMIILAVFSSDNCKKEIELSKKTSDRQTKQFDSMSLEARTLLIPSVLAIILTIIIPFEKFPDNVLSIIQNVLSALVSIVGLVFVIPNITQNHNPKGE